jgi:hypothetical protein
LVSVDFKGGTLKELAVALRGATKEPVNISLQGDAAGVEVEPMSLRNVTVESALRAAIGNRIGTQFLPDGSGLELKFESVQSGPEDASVFVITRSPSSFRNSPPPPRERVEVLSIQRLVSGDGATTPDVVLTAIDTGLMLQQSDREPRPQIKFHKDSGLLLIRGDPQDVALATEIVKRMMSDHDRQTSEAARRKAASIERGAALRQAMVKLRVAEAEADLAEQRVNEAAQQVDKGMRSPSELPQLKLEAQRAQANREMVQIEIDRLKQEEEAGIGGPGAEPGAGADTPASQDPRDAVIAALQARVAALEAQLGQKNSGDRKPPR